MQCYELWKKFKVKSKGTVDTLCDFTRLPLQSMKPKRKQMNSRWPLATSIIFQCSLCFLWFCFKFDIQLHTSKITQYTLFVVPFAMFLMRSNSNVFYCHNFQTFFFSIFLSRNIRFVREKQNEHTNLNVKVCFTSRTIPTWDVSKGPFHALDSIKCFSSLICVQRNSKRGGKKKKIMLKQNLQNE